MTKFRQAPESQKTFHLTETKRKVIAALAEFFCLSRKHITKLLYSKITEPSQASIRRTTSLLEAEHLITWRMLANHVRRSGNQPLIFGLTNKGVAKAAEE